MSKVKDRTKKAKRVITFENKYPPICSNCDQPGRHFVPPSLGESGFYFCNTNTQEQTK